MSLPPLTIIPAGAGSGKTYTIQEQLGEWVTTGEINPERIVAVTFTEAAASELSERIRAKLLEVGKLDDALRLDQAYISTIHGFGIRLLTEFSFDVGLSPQPRLLNADEENTLIRLALSRTDKVDAVLSQLHHFGYKYDFNTGLSAEEIFREDLLRMIQHLRNAGWYEGKPSFVSHAVEFIQDRYGPVDDGTILTEQLHACVIKLLEKFPESLAHAYKGNKAAYKALTEDFRHLKRASDKETLARDFRLWQALRKLRQSKRGSKLPDGYDELASAIIDKADALPRHPGPLNHAQTHIRALIKGGEDVLTHYAELKRSAGLVDYTDMIALADHMCREQPEILDALVNRIDCLVVDEFQDTNPLQFSLLWQLSNAGVPTVIVGDLKQAIMGFQGADPRLFEQLEQQYEELTHPLVKNWRSQPPVMDFVNALGPGLFGEHYTPLAPQTDKTKLVPLEAIEFSIRPKKDGHMIRAYALGQRLQALLDDDSMEVVDPRTKEVQPLRGGHIAVLCYTRNVLSQYASIFRAMGLQVRLQEEGWFSSRVVQLLWHAVAFVANPQDRHAALYLSVTELGELSIDEALAQLIEEDRIADPILDSLQGISITVLDRTVYAIVNHIITELNLFNLISTWPDGEQARADVLRFLAEAGEFMDANREAMASGGFYGSGLQSFLAWLNQKVELNEKEANLKPDPTVLDENAIELVTWHSSKGREWPIVAVGYLEKELKVKLPQMNIGYRDFNALENILDVAKIEYSPKFAAPEQDERFKQALYLDQENEALRLLYVAITRAREKLILEWPNHLNSNGSTFWSLLADKTGLSLSDDAWCIDGQTFPCQVIQGSDALPEAFDRNQVHMPASLPAIGRRAIEKSQVSGVLTPDSVSPSGLKGSLIRTDYELSTIEYAPALSIGIDLEGRVLGTFMHQVFELLGSDIKMTEVKTIERIASYTGVELTDEQLSVLIKHFDQFNAWVNNYFSPRILAYEIPVLALDHQNAVISGEIDLLIETDRGVWIIDHKTDTIEDNESGFEMYKPQLEAYEVALEQTGAHVLGTGIHWVQRSEISLCTNQAI